MFVQERRAWVAVTLGLRQRVLDWVLSVGMRLGGVNCVLILGAREGCLDIGGWISEGCCNRQLKYKFNDNVSTSPW